MTTQDPARNATRRPWRTVATTVPGPHRRAQHLDPLGGKHRVEPSGEPGIPITNQEPEPAEVVADHHQQVPGLLGHPLPPDALSHPARGLAFVFLIPT